MNPRKKNEELVEVVEIWKYRKTGEGFLEMTDRVAVIANGKLLKLYDGYVANIRPTTYT